MPEPRNAPRRRKGLHAIQEGTPARPSCSSQGAAQYPGQLLVRVDYRKNARRPLLVYVDGLLVLSYPASEEIKENTQ